MNPSLGRIVLYTDTYGETYPAMVTRVHSTFCVDLEVFGKAEDRLQTSVIHNDNPTASSSWRWPPRV